MDRMDRRVDDNVNGWVYRWVDGWVGERTYHLVDILVSGGWTDGWIGGMLRWRVGPA